MKEEEKENFCYSNTSLEEQETIINVDYQAKKVHLYTSRKSVIKRYKDKLGKPNKTYTTNGLISGCSWCIPFNDRKRLGIIFSRPNVIGNM